MSNGSSLFLGNGYKYSQEAKCDCCKHTVNELISLDKHKFTKSSSKMEKKYRKVCFYCASKLSFSGKYRFGTYWRKFFEELYIHRFNRVKSHRGNR